MTKDKLAQVFVDKFVPSDIIYAQSLRLKRANFVEILNGNLVFISHNKLFCVQNYAQFDDEILLNDKANIAQSLGDKVLSLFRLEKRLFYTASNADGFCLYAIDDERHSLLSNIAYPCLEEFIQVGKKEALLLMHNYNKSKSCVFYQNHNKLLPLSDEGDKIYSISLKDTLLYANINQEKIKAIAKKDFFKGFCKINSQNEINIENKIFKLMTFDDKIFLSPDIKASKILDENGKLAFAAKSDDSGQINSFIYTKTPFNRLYAVFSAWRNKGAPRSRVFISRNDFKVLASKTDSLVWDEKFKWTGFHCYKSGFVKWGESVIFTNVYEYPLIIHFKEKFSLASFKVSFKDDKSVVYESNLIVDKPLPILQTQTLANPNFYKDFSSIKKTKFFITIDVEQHLKNPKAFAITGEGLDKECGIYMIMDILERYKLKGVFFVNIYEHKNYQNKLIEKIIKDIHRKRARGGASLSHKSKFAFFEKSNTMHPG